MRRVVCLAGVAGILFGCSGSDKVLVPSATVQLSAPTILDLAPDRATVPKTLAPALTTTVLAVAPAPTVPIEDGLPVPNLLGVAEAALAAHDELFRQQVLPQDQWDRSKLLQVMTTEYADETLKEFNDTLNSMRRYESRSISERKVIRVESSPEGLDRAFAIVCWRDNGAEFDTRGTLETSDDLLIQDRLETFVSVIQMKRERSRWLRDGRQSDEDSKVCANAF